MNAIQDLARQEGNEYEQCLYDLYIRGAVDTALHHRLYGEALMGAAGPNPHEVDEWIATGWAMIEGRLDAIDILDSIAGCSVKVVETANATFETVISNELEQETIMTVADPRQIPALYAHLLHGIHPWAKHLITSRTRRSI
ncbi:hypothetical protein [Arthrobacter pigmenti]